MEKHAHLTWNDILWMIYHSEVPGLWQLDLPLVYLRACPRCRELCDGLLEMLDAGEFSKQLDYFELQLRYSRWAARKEWHSLHQAAPEILRQKLRRQAPTYGMVDQLVEESHRQASSDRDRALLLAEAAVEMAPRLPVHTPGEDPDERPFDHEALDSAARAEMLALAQAVLGNALRKLYRFEDAQAAFGTAQEYLLEMDEDDACIAQGRARVLSMKASLLIDTRCLDEAIDCLAEAAHASLSDRRAPLSLRAEIAINHSIALGLADRHEEALAAPYAVLEAGESSLPPRLRFFVRHRVAEQLVWGGDSVGARQHLHGVRELHTQVSQEVDGLRVEWLEGRILAAEGDLLRALETFQTIQQAFSEGGEVDAAALLALEIAALLLALDRPEATIEHARQAFALFVPLKLKDEMLAALTLLAHAADRGRLTSHLLAALIRFAQGGPLPEHGLWG